MPEVVGGGEGRTDLGVVRDTAGERAERLDARDEHVLVAVYPLEAAARKDKWLAADDRAMSLVDRRPDDQVHLAVLVLEQHEDDAVGGRGPLPRDRQARDRDLRAVREAGELGARDHAAQVWAQELHWVDADRERDVLVI